MVGLTVNRVLQAIFTGAILYIRKGENQSFGRRMTAKALDKGVQGPLV